ncbi:Plasmodium exported protein, unknown function [Plasmodium vivax]|uniref:Variable surface protein Vir35 n=1 Tax=Plasmodium vivax TaxID=5855 RepID=A0A565A6A5_PLAVI|nr:Plasmodium exported protein, unknown function [Plasmodium vivax]
MADLKNFDLGEKKNYIYIFKIVTVILLIWMYTPYHKKGNSDISLDKRTKNDNKLEIYFQRSLAKHEYKKNIDSSSMKERLPDYRIHKEIRNKKNISTYGRLNKEGLNKLDAYKKSYKIRYAKKKGFAKLDCYCEKKVFDKIDNICNLGEKIHKDKTKYKNKIHTKYTIFFITLSFLPLFPLIYSLAFNAYYEDGKYVAYKDANKIGKKVDVKKGPYVDCYFGDISKTAWDAMKTANSVFTFMLSIIVIIVILYIFIKFLKYEKLKRGKTKMGVMDYCKLCKDAFI